MQTADLHQEFERHRQQLRSFIFRIATNRADTEDIMQDTWLKASTKLESFKGNSSLKTWFFSIAANLAKDHLRARKRWPVNAMDLAREESMSDPDRHLTRFIQISRSPHGQFELREHINFCLTCIGKTLPLEQQIVVLLKEIFDFKISEIAEIMGITEGIVKHSLFDARKDLQEIFERRCSLINKLGACHQCSELNGLFNPKQNFQEEKLKAGLHDQDGASKEDLLNLRSRIGKAIDPYECDGRDLHFFHFDHIRNVLDAGAGA
ncbi:MAG TPA: RNA polymerase sigma factor [Chryseolinea sp.]|nr:RNA polymerase sigma factor [Chryseolinea sp.]